MGNDLTSCAFFSDAGKFLNEDERLERRARNARPIPIPSHKFKTFEPNEKIAGQGWKTLNTLSHGLALDVKIINSLYSLFVMADLDKGNTISTWEFLRFLTIDNTPFNRKVFRLFDMDESNEVDFIEFCIAIWNLATWPEESLGQMMFNVYDLDNSGYLELEECEEMIRDIFSARKDKTEQKLLIESLHDIAVPGIYSKDMRVYDEAYAKWTQSYPEVYHPLKCLHILVRNKVLGKDYWDQIGKRARMKTLETLQDMVRASLGPPGAMEAVKVALERQERELEREMQRKQQEAIWGGSTEDEEGLSSGHKQCLRETEERVKIVQYLHEERVKRFTEWFKVMSKVQGRNDPLSVLLRFSNRSFFKDLRKEFEHEWRKAMCEVQSKTYDRKGRLEALLRYQKPKDEVYFRRKNPRKTVQEDVNGFVQYSCATEKKTWVELNKDTKRTIKRAVRKAGGNKHLAKQDKDSEDEESTSSSDDYTTKEEDEEERRVYERGYDNAPSSSRKNAKKGQYKWQNLKRSSGDWRRNLVERLKRERDGIIDKNRKPYRAPKPGYKRSKRVYAID